jgi:hypothetical protein
MHARDCERITPGGPPASKREANAAAYLRAAQAYMLISMPTGTSTIFGVFQAIWLSLQDRANAALDINYCGKKSSPVKSLVVVSIFLCCTATGIHIFVRSAVKPMADQQVQDTWHHAYLRLRFDVGAARFRMNNLSESTAPQPELPGGVFDSCRGIFSTPGSATN